MSSPSRESSLKRKRTTINQTMSDEHDKSAPNFVEINIYEGSQEVLRIFEHYKGPFNKHGRIRNKKPDPEDERKRMDSKVDILDSLRLSNVEQRRLDMLNDLPLELAQVTVDTRHNGHTTFELPRRWLTDTSANIARTFNDLSNQPNAHELTNVQLTAVYASHFHDFVRWLRGENIVPTPHMNATYAIELNARRTLDALALGVYIDSKEYQIAAMIEFLELSCLLEWPEDFVNNVFAATALFANTQEFRQLMEPNRVKVVHPARNMIVAIIAAKTVGPGKRRVRVGGRDGGVERGDRIEGTLFWEMYDDYVRTRIRDGECTWPVSIQEFC